MNDGFGSKDKSSECFGRMTGLSALLPFVAGAANDWIEPEMTDAAPCSNGRNPRQTGRSVSARYAYS